MLLKVELWFFYPLTVILKQHSSNMNSRNNNLLHIGYWLHADSPYDDASRDRRHVSLISHCPDSTTGTVGPLDPFGSRVHVPPFALARVISQPPLQNLARNTNMPRDAHLRPRYINHSPVAVDPLLNVDEQYKGLEKLRREIYNPGVQRVSLYYRDNDFRVKSREKQNNEDGKRCAVCLDDFEPREMVTLTPCNHMFHENCIVPWVKSRGQCPVCRFTISEGNKEHEGSRTSNNSQLGNDPFARDLISFIRNMEARG